MQKTVSHTPPRTDAWHRWSWVWSLIFYVTLAASFAQTLAPQDLTSAAQRQVIVLTIASALWHLVSMVYLLRRLPECRERPGVVILYLTIAFAMWWMLVNIDQAFYLLLFGLYSQVFALLAVRWAIPVSFVVTALVLYQQMGAAFFNLSLSNYGLWLFLIMIGSGTIFALWLNAIISQSMQRADLIQQLQETQEELAQAEREAGTLAERQRLAGEIHDTLAQGFTSIVMHLEAAEQALPPEATAVQKHLDAARLVARESLAEARGLVWSLQPEQLERASLPEVIERTVKKWLVETGLAGEVRVTGEPAALHPQAEVTLLRATQEALANVRKHAAATRVTVTLSYFEDLVILDVQDDGRGFAPEKLTQHRPGLSGGFGLRTMQERAAQLGGKLTVESAPNEGTTVTVELPL